MKTDWNIYTVFVQNGVSYLAQYRKDAWWNVAVNVLWVGMLFLIVEVIFSQTATIVGWKKEEVYLLTILWTIVSEAFVMIFGGNTQQIPHMITDGDLDIFLTKPANTLFLVSTRFFLFRAFYRLLADFGILAWIVWRFDVGVSLPHAVLAFFLVVCGIIVHFSMTLLANTLSFWFLRIDNVNDTLVSLHTLGRYPIDVFPKTLKILLLTALPMAFSGYIPVAVLTGRWPWYAVGYAVCFTAAFFCLAVRFWSFALKRYSSASS